MNWVSKYEHGINSMQREGWKLQGKEICIEIFLKIYHLGFFFFQTNCFDFDWCDI